MDNIAEVDAEAEIGYLHGAAYAKKLNMKLLRKTAGKGAAFRNGFLDAILDSFGVGE